MKVLYIGGTGEISYACVSASVEAGHECAVFNRGKSREALPRGVRSIVGDLGDEKAYGALGRERFDVVCQFKAYSVADIERDKRVFGGKVGQYVFISTASAYQKPPVGYRMTEDVPLHNPFWEYSQAKAEMEGVLRGGHESGRMPVTIVRPSHTIRTKFPGTFISGDEHAWRMINGRPVIVHGDGTALWTITAAEDFAIPFARLLGNAKALGEAFHITMDEAHSWNDIFAMVGEALGVEARLVHVPTETLVRYRAEWAGPLMGDKAWSTLFDNSKVKGVAGEFDCRWRLADLMKRSAERFRRERMGALSVDEELHALVDRIAEEQMGLGR